MKILRWIAGVLGSLVVLAGIGFWLRPVSYFNESMYVRECLSGASSRSVQVAGHRVH